MILRVVRPEMAMNFDSKEVESMLDEGAVHGLMVGLKICSRVLLAYYCLNGMT